MASSWHLRLLFMDWTVDQTIHSVIKPLLVIVHYTDGFWPQGYGRSKPAQILSDAFWILAVKMDVIITAEQRNLTLAVRLECRTTVIASSECWGNRGVLYSGLSYRNLTIAIWVRRCVHFVVHVWLLTSDIISSDLRVKHALQRWVVILDKDFACDDPLSIHSHPCLWIYSFADSLRLHVLFELYDLRLLTALGRRDWGYVWWVVLVVRLIQLLWMVRVTSEWTVLFEITVTIWNEPHRISRTLTLLNTTVFLVQIFACTRRLAPISVNLDLFGAKFIVELFI